MLIDLNKEKDSKIWPEILQMMEGLLINSSDFKKEK